MLNVLLLIILFEKNYLLIPFNQKLGLTLSLKGSAEYSANEVKDHLKTKFALTYKF